jgi:hypothetical protein
MNAEQESNQYLLLFRGTDWDKRLSPEEIQQIMTRWNAWFEGLTEKGIAKGGQPLAEEGKVVSGKGGQTVVDGPFAESKEAIAGYFLLQVNQLEEALQIARQCPALDYGMQVEVRQVVECCAAGRAARAHAASTSG